MMIGNAFIGEYAGIVWHTLNEQKKELSIVELKELCAIESPYLEMAIGWLARENKVYFEEQKKKLLIGLTHNHQEG